MLQRRPASSRSQPGEVRPRVLFVDDERLVLEGLRDSLRRFPFDIHSAESPDRGLEILASMPIDVVVSDERMPGMSGSEFLALVCEMYPETVRIILSGQESPAAGYRALYEAEVFRFVRKPCRAAELAEIIDQALAEKRRRDET
ncbi:MAG TPA: response regulator [Kofleriaceae bacterium]|nr:response regulator [Kofleriaceae bacterium]